MKYLVDSSVLIRMVRKQIDSSWEDLADRGLLSVCEPAVTETLMTADAKKCSALEDFIADSYLPVMMPEGVWDLLVGIRRKLAAHAAHHGLSVADLLIAATAIRLKLTVLHEDGDFETVARFVPELKEHRVGLVLS
jgi:predicted nucleic acid-binding protein